MPCMELVLNNCGLDLIIHITLYIESSLPVVIHFGRPYMHRSEFSFTHLSFGVVSSGWLLTIVNKMLFMGA